MNIAFQCQFSVSLPTTEAVARKCSVKKVFLKISQNSRENNCARVSFLKSALLKKKLLHRRFPVNSAKISKNTFSYRVPPVAASGNKGTIRFIQRRIQNPVKQLR